MGLGEMFGVKQIKLVVKENYTIQEFYDKIKDVKFEAGKPELVKNGFAKVIIFPQLDRNNQVQILGDKGKFQVVRNAQPAGVGNMVSNIALEHLTDGVSGMSAAFGDTKKKCMELVQKTADTINAMGI